MNGASTLAQSLSTDVEIGSAADDLSGSRPIVDSTSETVVGENLQTDSEQCLGLNVGGGDPSVEERTPSTLSTKYLQKYPAGLTTK